MLFSRSSIVCALSPNIYEMISSLLLTLFLIGIALLLGYYFLIWNFDYWKKKGVRGPKPTPFYGNFSNMVKQQENVAVDMLNIYKQHRDDEDFIGVFQMRTPQLMVLNPQLAHQMFVTDFNKFHDNELSTWINGDKDPVMSNNAFMLCGDQWKERRKDMIPLLTANRIKAVYPATQETCGKLTEFIRGNLKDVDAKDLSLRYTSDVVSDCVLGVKANSLTDNPTPILKWTKVLFQQSTAFLAYAFAASLWPTLKSIIKIKLFRQDVEDFFFKLVNDAIKLRRQKNVERADILNYLLQFQEKKNLSETDMFSNTMTFLVDGFETTALVLSSCLYQLAKYPMCQEKLRNEIESNLSKDGKIEFDQLETLPYIDQCIHESLRIMPPLLFGTKLCTQPTQLENKNGDKLHLRPSEAVLIPFYAFHHDERYYPQPNEFIPERFNSENGGVKKYRDMGVFYGFGDGPRICLGMRFALVQLKAALAEIVVNFHVKLNSKTRTDNRLNPKEFLGTLDGGVWLDFDERT